MFGIFLWKEDCLCYYWSPVSNFYLMPIHLNEMKNAFKSGEGLWQTMSWPLIEYMFCQQAKLRPVTSNG